MPCKIVTVVGARPQFIKAAAVSREIEKHESLQEVLIHTGQHFDINMSDVFFNEMKIPKPDYFLNVNGLSHGAMTGQMLEKIENVLLEEKPEYVLVYGDTNSTLAGALAAKKLNIKVLHVEAGLRSFNMQMPEEINRVMTDRISDFLFCPTISAKENLEKEGFAHLDCNIKLCGDVMYDAALYYASLSPEESDVIERLDLGNRAFILATIHRQENTNDLAKLNAIISALNTINRDTPVIVPLHPRTQKIINLHGLEVEFTLTDPVGYFDMLELLKKCQLVMTDSGGLQKEAYFFEKNCLTLREETEWVELVEQGVNILTGAVQKRIIDGFTTFQHSKSSFDKPLFGDGHASKKIVDTIYTIKGR